MNNISQQLLTKLNMLIVCNPEQCQELNCPLYTNNSCRWEKILNCFDTVIQEKFKNKTSNQSENSSD